MMVGGVEPLKVDKIGVAARMEEDMGMVEEKE